VAGVGRFWVRFVSGHGRWRSLWVVAVVGGRGGRCGLWWSLWTVVVVGVGRFWARFVSGHGRWRSLWVVAVVGGRGGRCGLWWSLWTVVVVGVGRFWARFVSGHGRWRSLWVVAVVVGRGGRCGPWWSLWAVVVVVGRSSRSVWGRCSRWPLSSIVLHWVVCRHGWWCCSFVGGCCRDCQTTQHVVDVPRRCHLPCRVAYEEERVWGLLTWTLRHRLDDVAHTVDVPRRRYHEQSTRRSARALVGR